MMLSPGLLGRLFCCGFWLLVGCEHESSRDGGRAEQVRQVSPAGNGRLSSSVRPTLVDEPATHRFSRVRLEQARFAVMVHGEEQRAHAGLFEVRVTSSVGTVRTHVTIEMQNPEDTAAEGVLRLPIPPGAAVTGADLHVNGQRMPGAFVHRRRAQQIHETMLSEHRDPLFAKWDGPEWLDMSVFPIEAGGHRRFEVSWVEPAGRGRLSYRVPVLAHRGQVVARPSVSVDGSQVSARAWLGASAVTATSAKTAVVARRAGERSGYIMTTTDVDEIERDRVVIVLQSSSTVDDRLWQQQIAVLCDLLSKLGEQSRVTVLTGDWLVQSIVRNETVRVAAGMLDELDRIEPMGTLSLDRVIEGAVDEAVTMGASSIVYIGAGDSPLTERFPARIIERLQQHQLEFSAISERPSSTLVEIAWRTEGVVLQNARWRSAHLLTRRAEAGLPTLVGGTRWYPLQTISGQTAWIARFVGDAPVDADAGVARDLAALWQRARIIDVARRDGDAEMMTRVVTPWTSIVALDDAARYKEWGIPLKTSPMAYSTSVAKQELTRDLGVLRHLQSSVQLAGSSTSTATSGKSISGRGNPFATPAWVRRSRPAGPLPSVSMRVGRASSTDGMPESWMRRVMVNATPRLAFCYELALLGHPRLQGTMTLEMVLATSGAVRMARVTGMNHDVLHGCVARAMRSVRFPKPRSCGMTLARVSVSLSRARRTATSASDRERRRWRRALAIVDRAIPLKRKLDRIARAIGLDTGAENRSSVLDAPALARQIVTQRLRRAHQPAEAYVLAARLLRDAGQFRQARRVLSEGLLSAPLGVVRVFKRWSLTADRVRATQLLVGTDGVSRRR